MSTSVFGTKIERKRVFFFPNSPCHERHRVLIKPLVAAAGGCLHAHGGTGRLHTGATAHRQADARQACKWGAERTARSEMGGGAVNARPCGSENGWRCKCTLLWRRDGGKWRWERRRRTLGGRKVPAFGLLSRSLSAGCTLEAQTTRQRLWKGLDGEFALTLNAGEGGLHPEWYCGD
jgi:hypothetical protein